MFRKNNALCFELASSHMFWGRTLCVPILSVNAQALNGLCPIPAPCPKHLCSETPYHLQLALSVFLW